MSVGVGKVARHLDFTRRGVLSQSCRLLRLLLVEDDPELRRMLAGLLIDEGYAVDEAPDGHRGLHLGLSRSYDLVVLDRCLPAWRASTCLPACVPAGSLTAGADPVRLSERESALLATLAGRPGQVYPRRELLARCSQMPRVRWR